MTGFLGRFDHQIDEKGRVSLPAAFRRDADSERFVLLPNPEPYLTLLTQEAWAEVRQKLDEWRSKGRKQAHFARRVLADLEPVAPDRQGRILIPQRLKERAGLNDQVVVLGSLDRLELWQPKAFQDSVTQSDPDGASAAEFEDFLQEIHFGKPGHP